jgi:hypothetical protein
MIRELAARTDSGVEVELLWDDARDQVVLRYKDTSTGEKFVVDVPNDSALAAYEHPNAYRPRRRRTKSAA